MGGGKKIKNLRVVPVNSSNKDICEQNITPVHKVLQLDLLLEIIINYAIRHKCGDNLCTANLSAVRRVSKLWRNTSSNVMRRNREPMFHLTFDQTYAKPLVDKFLRTLGPKMNKCSFFIGLKAVESFFDWHVSGLHYTLKTFMRQFAHRVANLELCMALDDCWQLTNHFEEWMPVLKKLTVKIAPFGGTLPDASLLFQRRAKLSKWLQFQLNGNETLQELEFSNLDLQIFVDLPAYPLPVSLTKLKLRGQFQNDVLDFLANISLPNLAELKLFLVPYTKPVPVGYLNRLLSKFSEKLRVLHLDVAEDGMFPSETVHPVTFPVMKKLEELKTTLGSWQLESEILDYDQHFPNLKRLTLFCQTETMFAKWISGMPAPTVEAFGFEISRETSEEFTFEFREIDIQQIHQTFPNIRSLALKFTVKLYNPEGLGYLYKSMKQLTSLTFILSDTEDYPRAWESILTGVPDIWLKGQGSSEALWEFIPKVDSCIRNLTGLVKLSLDDNRDEEFLFVSDFVFDYALLKMPNLIELSFGEGLQISERSLQAWKNKGGTFSIH